MAMGVVSAAPVAVTNPVLQHRSGLLVYAYFMNGALEPCTNTPQPANTQLSPSATTGTSNLNKNTPGCLWSPPYASANPLVFSQCALVLYVSHVPPAGATVTFTLAVVSGGVPQNVGSGTVAVTGNGGYFQTFTCSGTLSQNSQLRLTLSTTANIRVDFGGDAAGTPTDFQVTQYAG